MPACQIDRLKSLTLRYRLAGRKAAFTLQQTGALISVNNNNYSKTERRKQKKY